MGKLRGSALFAASAVVLAACGASSDGDDGFDPLTEEGGTEDRASVAGTDLTQSEVPLDDVIFDTFDGGSIPLSEASEDDVLGLRDLIIPIGEPTITPDNPEPIYRSADEEDGLDEDDFVLGYVTDDGEAFAYPHRILTPHEIVNDDLGGIPVLVSYCPLCNSGVVFDRRLPDGTELSFGNTSALYENDLVMYDVQTLSYWWQVPGRAIVGELSGTTLEPLPSMTTTWEEWTELHPDTQVLSTDQGFGRGYEPAPIPQIGEQADRGVTPFPIDPAVLEDDRLDSSTNVVGVDIGDEARAYAVTGEADAIHDTVGGQELVVLLGPDGGAVFLPEADGEGLTFAVAPDGRGWVDEETGTRWDGAGRALDGPLEGAQLEALPSRSTFWFAYLSSFPEVEVWDD